MSVTKAPAESLAAMVKSDLQTPSTASQSTLTVLRALLGIDLGYNKDPVAQLAPKQRLQSRTNPLSNQKAGKPATGRKGKPDFQIYGGTGSPANPLPPDQKRALATEAFNIALKQLSQKVKEKQNGIPLQSAEVSTRAISTTQKVLLSRSPNRRPPGLSREKSNTPTKTVQSVRDQDLSLEAIAQCAIVALQCLDGLSRTPSASGSESAGSLIRGGQILLDKLIGLGLTEQAIEQVWQFRQQLRILLGETFRSIKREEALSSAMAFAALPHEAGILGIALAFQLQVMKVGSLIGPTFLDQQLQELLEDSNQASPLALCLKAIEAGALSEDKAGQLVHGFSLILARICSTVRGKTISSMTPVAHFQLNVTSLRMRCLSWKLLGHKPDIEKEIWSPLACALRVYSETAGDVQTADSLCIKEKISAIQNLLVKSGQNDRLPPNVVNVLVDIFQRSDLREDALALLKIDDYDSSGSGLPAIVKRCRVATIVLGDASSNSATRLDCCEKALSGFKSSLKGTATELRDLLLWGARLRKAAVTTALSLEKSIQSSQAHQDEISLQFCSIRLVYSIAAFMVRYLAQYESQNNNKILEETKTAICNSSRNTVDSVLSIVKCSNVRSAMLWDDTETAMADCLKLSTLVEEINNPGAEQVHKKSSPSTYLKMSNIYWVWYLQDKDVQKDLRSLCLLLERSLEALERCPAQEKLVGFETVKRERVASIYQAIGETKQSNSALLLAIKTAIMQGALHEAIEIVLTKPSKRAWTDTKLNAHVLGSCLRKLGRAYVHAEILLASDACPFFDDENLPDIHRAQVLELQLFAIAELQLTAASKTIITTIATRILELCRQPQYHVYRIRFIRDLLTTSARRVEFPIHDILDDELLQTACTFQQTSVTIPCFLAAYGPILRLSVLLQWAFLTTRPSLEYVRNLIESCGSLLSQCKTVAALEAVVDDSESLLRQLAAAADYAGMLDSVDTRLTALRLRHQVLRLQSTPDVTSLANCLVEIGKALNRLGETFEAGRSFAEAEKLLDKNAPYDEARLLWSLAYSAYLIDVEAFDKASASIKNAQSMYIELTAASTHTDRGNYRLKQDSFLGYAALVASKLAFRQDDLRSAVTHARQCVKLTTGLWVALEKLFDGVKDHLDALGLETTHTSIEETLNTTFSVDQTGLQAVVKGVPFWTHIDMHFQALLHMSSLSAHCGLYPDAVYYAGLASRLSRILTSEQRQTTSKVRLALLHAKAGHDVDARLSMKGLTTCTLSCSTDLDTATCGLDLASAALSLNDVGTSSQYLEKAKVIIAKRTLPGPASTSIGLSAVTALDKQLNALTLSKSKTSQGSKPRKVTKTQATPATRGRQRGLVLSSNSQAPSGTSDNEFASPVFTRLQEAHDTLALQIELCKGKACPAAQASDMIHPLLPNSASGPKKLIDATLLLNQALVMFGSDAVHCVLAETALAYPSKYSARRPSGRVSALSATTVSVKAKRISPKDNGRQQPGRSDSSADEAGPLKLLQNAYDLVSSASTIDIDQSSSDTIHSIQKLFCRLSMLANAVGLSLSYSPIKVVHDSLKPKDIILLRESFVLGTDQTTAEGSELRTWPSVTGASLAVSIEGPEQIQALTSLVGDLPETWSVVSISLNESQTEMLLSRMMAGSTPLILRIPLARSAIDDADESEFTFYEAKEELASIINDANLTAHDSRSQAEKAARKVWWAEREALDHRLETLLLNIENIWLGGFRGLVSQQQRSDAELLSRFASSLDVALEKHLPSRQKTGGTLVQKVRLHGHILDLFVALGHPDETELDDAITDLLYFVVDILQFEGERNAYDEIDFDAILVDVLDALRSYHEACPKDPSPSHTILILDKELHAFPWESIPCLLNKSVSRMPSMSMIHDRLSKIQTQTSHPPDAYCIPSDNGAYILNPSSDLSSTQSTFSGPFTTHLPTYTAITSRPPSESEFASLLSEKDLLLYFGHGSGAQYIRGRRIKAMDRCAVTFLMGCSSGRMVECGAFESHGTPWNYMHAGSMAIVGTLWDVTDRDIDRFALTCFDEWGLLHDVGEDEKDRKKTEARKKMRMRNGGAMNASTRAKRSCVEGQRKGKGQVALDEALNRARDACILRYLNGAAAVMYGLPVMLE